jgi:hypothetical protein
MHDLLSSIKTVQGNDEADPTDILRSFAEELGDSMASEVAFELQEAEAKNEEAHGRIENEAVKEKNLVKIYSMQKKLLQERKAYKEGLPLDFYDDLEDLANLEC